ncbi:MAG: M28 family peptidase [Flavisolibacter sp.]|jgi:Zn-dependent M28 family amino/carboxypeptidase
MKKILPFILLVFVVSTALAQKQDVINARQVSRIENVLASDQMRGRKSGTPDIDVAAKFIADEFKKAGLQPLQGNSFFQEFSMVRSKQVEVKGEINDTDLDVQNIIVVTSQPEMKVDEKSGFDIQYIQPGDNMLLKARSVIRSDRNTVVFVDTSFSKSFPRLSNFRNNLFKSNTGTVFILGIYQPKEFKIKSEQTIEETKYTNVVGMLPGKGRKNENVIFSAHYDHLGIARQPMNGDSIYNGANDDAAGTTAVILLANYFKKLHHNERTLVFAAFTAEEVGGFGSQYFSKQFNPQQVMAMFNIEMIGTESKWGKNSAYITGYDKTNMGEILQKNLQGSSFTFYPDPYTKENLFYRSDNATLARQGVPAHTISTAKMENEPNYHKVTDEVSTLDFENMAAIIRAIAISSRSIISGMDTPSRVKPETLNQ